jgi:hypothetical protein
MGDLIPGFVPPAEKHAFVFVDAKGQPLATFWGYTWNEATEMAFNLYGAAASARLADDAPWEWLIALDREARATHAENVRLEAERQLRARVARITEKMHKLFPWLHP